MASDQLALDTLISLIKRFEGCHLTPYLCPAGVLTCGWGATGAGVNPGEPWTQEQADARLASDATAFMLATKSLCPSLCGERLGAISDFAYNLGVGALRSSTLRRVINAGDVGAVPVQLMRWTKAAGRVMNGLVRRRRAECVLFNSL